MSNDGGMPCFHLRGKRDSSMMKMEEIFSSEMSVNVFQTTGRNILEERKFPSRSRENTKIKAIISPSTSRIKIRPKLFSNIKCPRPYTRKSQLTTQGKK
jgi:hypothetical protein